MATDVVNQVDAIAKALDATDKLMQSAARSISGLLNAGRATCDEVKAYNLWALGTYNAQRGMLATMRAAGQPNVPTLPPAVQVFGWRGHSGNDAINVDCESEGKPLSDANARKVMRRALRGPTAKTKFLSADQIQIMSTDQWDANPALSPSLSTLQTQTGDLGLAPVIWIVIGLTTIGVVYAALTALSKYFIANSIQVEATERTRLKAQAFATYAAARLGCYTPCLSSGRTADECTDTCSRLITKPDLSVDFGYDPAWGMFQWIGAIVVIGTGAIVAHKIYKKKQAGESLLPNWLHLPSGHG